jgi:hypothetical protein
MMTASLIDNLTGSAAAIPIQQRRSSMEKTIRIVGSPLSHDHLQSGWLEESPHRGLKAVFSKMIFNGIPSDKRT